MSVEEFAEKAGTSVAMVEHYVFVNLWSEPKGRPLAYSAVYDLVSAF
jgi:hypothetical protein